MIDRKGVDEIWEMPVALAVLVAAALNGTARPFGLVPWLEALGG